MALRILVCVKRVPAPGARITLTADHSAIDVKNLGFTTSPHEECAVEEAIRLVEQHGGEATVLTLGAAEAEEQLRYAISVGIVKAVHISHPSLVGESDWDPQATAAALADTIASIEAADGAFDLILFGNESADAGGFQVGVRVARKLGRPIVNGIKSIEVGDTAVVAQRESTSGFEVYNLPLPAVLGVKEGLNLPRYPTLPGRLKSKKAEISAVAAEPVAGGLLTESFDNAAELVVQTTMLGTGEDAAPAIVDLIERLGLL
ncbi:MAG: electron transfer flavoprotein beta subunit/FixA family protein [Ilumatobacteraceae bacterium]|nr:electron transfer flavoprotein beta subunit/FixA family protein [Ilumatobacteraceae bacterium]